MHSHDSTSAPENSDPIPGGGDGLPPVRRSFPVPKVKKAVVENDEELVAIDRPAWGIWIMLVSAVIMFGAAVWIKFRPGGGSEHDDPSRVPASMPTEPRRKISTDPAVETYFTRSTPGSRELREEPEPSSPPAVAMPQTPQTELPGAGSSPAPGEEDGVFEIRNDDLSK